MKDKTLVLGASTNPERYSYLAIQRLRQKGHRVLAIGGQKGEVNGVAIGTKPVTDTEVDTVTLYLNPERQKSYYEYIFSLGPRRIIFNPGAENDELEQLARARGIVAQEACTLVLLGTGQY